MPEPNVYRFPKGARIIKEGDLDARAYEILSGSVEVYLRRGGAKLPRRVLGPGQIFGELGLILERPRTASVDALEDVEVRCIDHEDFNRLLREDPERLVPVLRTLFERLRQANMSFLGDDGARGGATTAASLRADRGPSAEEAAPLDGTAWLAPASAKAKELLGDGRVELKRLPFKVGRSSGALKDIFSDNDLPIEDQKPYTVSRNHFLIAREDERGGLIVRDRGSSLGTIVNGVKLGGRELRSEAPLDRRKNLILLGDERSRFALEVTIE